ncbi:hypothetical protein HYH03_016003 [Edaphochlamys debaryana]|uniref:Cyclic nucleotide-binding domain-containing protein n=1 Tax=Edaphochlamys debaryana TaxID=47281 RepID=A0A836BQA7_9CHLO|nr:hypothetical protein HYH03_016003 [Edaphochlamys debaryana]|eukprot:KAG2485216.1 hypothetical protein HYH03_016003 [Edaphochlamys debaryana]
MAASVAFLHQQEFDAQLDEYENEAKWQHDKEEEDELAARANSSENPKRLGSGSVAQAAHDRQAQLRRSRLKGTGLKAHGKDNKSAAIAHWLSSAPGPGAGPSAGGAPGRQPGPWSPVNTTAGGKGARLQSSPSMLRRSDSMIQKPSLWHRTVHADMRGIMDSILPIYNPDTLPKKSWDVFIMSLVVWTAVTVPLSVSYGMPHGTPWEAVDYTMTAMFAIDLILNFRTAFYNHQGELIRDSGAIARNYMKFWFWIDLVGTIPFDSIILWTGVISESADNEATLAALGFLKAPRMLRLGRLLRFLDSFKNAKMFRIAQLFMAMILISHWLACIWYMMYRFGGQHNAEDWAFDVATEDEQSETVYKYVVSYYYCFLLLVGDNIPAYNNYERTFYVVVLVAGTFFYSAIVGQMATLVATMNVAVNRHAQKLLMVQDALRYAGVPEGFAEKVQTYFEYLQARSHPGSEGMQFLQELPASLHASLCQFLHLRSLKKVPLFADCESGFLTALSLRMRMISLSPKEEIFRVGDVGKEMYIIKKGNVAVTSPNRQMWGLLCPGDIFGEVALLSTGKRTANCTALGFIDLAVLGGVDLQMVMRDYPVSAAMIHERAAERARTLQSKSKMWLEVSDDEEDLVLEEEEDEWSDVGRDEERGGDLDALGADDVSVSSSGLGSGGGSDAGGGAAKGRKGGGEGVANGDGRPAEGDESGPGRPRSRPASAASGRALPPWAAADAPPAQGLGAAAAAAASPLSVPRLSLDMLPNRSPPPAAAQPRPTPDGPDAMPGAGANSAPGLASGHPTLSHSHSTHSYAHSHAHSQSNSRQGTLPGFASRVSSVTSRGHSGAAPSESGDASPAHAHAHTHAASPGPGPIPVAYKRSASQRRGSTTYTPVAAGSPSLLGPDEAAATVAAVLKTLGSPAQTPTAGAGGASSRRRSMAFWLGSEESAALGPPPEVAAALAATAAGAPAEFTPSQDPDDLVWLAPRAASRTVPRMPSLARRPSTRFAADGPSSPPAAGAAAAAAAQPVARSSAAVRRGSQEGLLTAAARRGSQEGALTAAARRGSQEGLQAASAATAGLLAHPALTEPQSNGGGGGGGGGVAPGGPGIPADGVDNSVTLLHRFASSRLFESPASTARQMESPGPLSHRGAGGDLLSSLTGSVEPTPRPGTAPVGVSSRIMRPLGVAGNAAGGPNPAGGAAPAAAAHLNGHSAAAATAAATAAAAAAVAAAIAGDPSWPAHADAAVAASAALNATAAAGRGRGPGPVAEAIEPPSPTVCDAARKAAKRPSIFRRLTEPLSPSPAQVAPEPIPAALPGTNSPGAPPSPFATPFPELSSATSVALPAAASATLPATASAVLPAAASTSTSLLPDGAAILRLNTRRSTNFGALSPLPSGVHPHLTDGQHPAGPHPDASAPAAPVAPTRRPPRLSMAEAPLADDGNEVFGHGDEPEWISTRTPLGRARYRRGSVESIKEEELFALAPAGGGVSGSGPLSPGQRSPGPRSPIASAHGTIHSAFSSRGRVARRSSAESLYDRSSHATTQNGLVPPSPHGHGADGPGLTPGPPRSRATSGFGMLTTSPSHNPGSGTHSRRASAYGLGAVRSSRISATGLAPRAPPPPPPPPPPEGVFVPKAAWNQLLTAVSKLSTFETAMTELLDLVTLQDEALGRLETKAAKAAAMGGGAGNMMMGASTSVLGIVAPHLGGGGPSASGGSRSAGGAGGNASARAALIGGRGPGGGASSSMAGLDGPGGGPVNGSGAMGSNGQLRGDRIRRAAGQPNGELSGSGGMAGAAAAAIAADTSDGGEGPQPASARQRVQGAVRAMALTARLRNTLAGSRSQLPPLSDGGGEQPSVLGSEIERAFSSNSIPVTPASGSFAGGRGGSSAGQLSIAALTSGGGGTAEVRPARARRSSNLADRFNGVSDAGPPMVGSFKGASGAKVRRSSLLAVGSTPALKSALKGGTGGGGGQGPGLPRESTDVPPMPVPEWG